MKAWANMLRVFWYMIKHMPIFSFYDLFRPQDRDAYFRKIYLQWGDRLLGWYEATVDVRGRENYRPDWEGGWVILANHQSQLDIPVLLKALHAPLTFVAKKELSYVPFLSYWMKKVGCIFIDRKDKAAARKTLQYEVGRLPDRPLVVFPEGTRSRDGRLLPFKPGSGRIPLLANARVLPVLIQGSRDAVENRRAFGNQVTVQVTVFPPLDTRGWEDSRDSLEKIRSYVEDCWNVGWEEDAQLASSTRGDGAGRGQ